MKQCDFSNTKNLNDSDFFYKLDEMENVPKINFDYLSMLNNDITSEYSYD